MELNCAMTLLKPSKMSSVLQEFEQRINFFQHINLSLINSSNDSILSRSKMLHFCKGQGQGHFVSKIWQALVLKQNKKKTFCL